MLIQLMKNKSHLSRCIYLITLLLYTFSAPAYAFLSFHQEDDSSFKVAVCDWMILKRQKIGSFQLASELGYDGVELDMGSLGTRDSFDNK